MLTRQAIGKRIFDRRHHLGLSQEALAAVAGVSRETIRGIETGATSPNLVTIGKIADGLQMSASALLAEHTSDELTELVAQLPCREQKNLLVMIRALSDHLAVAGR